MLTEDFAARYSDSIARVGAPSTWAQLRVRPSDDGAAHVECLGSELYYVVTERGRELERRKTNDPDVLLYWLLSDVTHEMASSYAARNRQDGVEFRMILFEKQLQLLARIDERWRVRREAEIKTILERDL